MVALSQDLSQNRPVEAREHVRRFHELFFTLSPDKDAIESNVKRALYLADGSAIASAIIRDLLGEIPRTKPKVPSIPPKEPKHGIK